MGDLNRTQAIEWCVNNGADFITPIFPPPSGWAWADFDSNKSSLVLTAIFTNTDDADILAKDVIFAYAQRNKKSSESEIVQKMLGRAEFLRDRGEVKTPEILEQAATLLTSKM